MQQQQEQEVGRGSQSDISQDRDRRSLDDGDGASVYTVLPSYEALPPQPPSFAEASASAENAPTTVPTLQQKPHQSTLKGVKAKLKELQKQSEAHRQERHTLTSEETSRMTTPNSEREGGGGKSPGCVVLDPTSSEAVTLDGTG
ncbi:hypothetical protein AA313_de0202163 [Arthrobotrys entomopaga]|nr:hypothetical protein AA313_de0202163 [Arthrobotrys entomopaga]